MGTTEKLHSRQRNNRQRVRIVLLGLSVVLFVLYGKKSLLRSPKGSTSAEGTNDATPAVTEPEPKSDIIPEPDKADHVQLSGHVPLIEPAEAGYKPAPVETYIMTHIKELKLDAPIPKFAPTCPIFTDPQVSPHHTQLQDFMQDLDDYYRRIKTFQTPLKDLRRNMTKSNKSVCELLKLHPEGLPGIFEKSGQLSYSSSGWIEPLLPTMRHPRFCFPDVNHTDHRMRIDYMVHDFRALCRKLKPKSRTIFIDMGASLSFHTKSPAILLIDLYNQFGFHFDHVYGWEYTKLDPDQVMKDIPDYLEASYHWINVGVESDPNSRQNPLRLVMDNYEEDDLIIVKLDIDTPQLERELAQQLVDYPKLGKLIDHFYFEHHVNQAELRDAWGPATETVADSLNLFYEIRKRGIPAHYWV